MRNFTIYNMIDRLELYNEEKIELARILILEVARESKNKKLSELCKNLYEISDNEKI